MQTILGSTGIIGKEVARELYRSYTKDIRLVSRNPKPVNPTDQLFKADLLDRDQVRRAVEGSEIVYLTVGIQYSAKLWAEQWPVIMRNVIEACKAEKAKLVFFDNVYAYGKVDGVMTEETPYNPCSKKGTVRLKVINMMMDEVRKGNLEGLIARAPDFYGPDTPLSVVSVTVFGNLAKGKEPQWMVDDRKKHSFIFTPDAGKATALLGNTPSAFNQVWHLPTDSNTLTGKEFVVLAARAFGMKPSYMVLPKWLLRTVGLFNPIIRESLEMLYQNEVDYIFDSSKFEKAFGFAPTPYPTGIEETARSYK
ncbi:MAG TPA: NAD-dependent epimerase/dehydratase family protein [Bacteroidales bacterium]|nr:NAD-dependent epimerase/dehydratase family protein [Bacteroidales bacterium]HOX78806.1 NAD-dependent epimerase/dehydratase family protein [Bacteroidales bacterium]HPM92812.1 NAD-dependent epimerase/dehydratase family protein [Bacteroidales bacterium]